MRFGDYIAVAVVIGLTLTSLAFGALAMWAAMRCRAPGVSRWRAARALRWIGSLSEIPIVFEPPGVRHARRAVRFARWQLAALATVVLVVVAGAALGL